MTRWTEEQLVEYLSRHPSSTVRHKAKRYAGHTMSDLADTFQPDEGPESKLQGKIEKWCAEHAYPIQSNRQSKHAKSMLTIGWPDCTICLPRGKILFVELKSEKGRLSDAQKALRLQFIHLGHSWNTIRSFRAFLALISEII